jgi:hypothetical protein
MTTCQQNVDELPSRVKLIICIYLSQVSLSGQCVVNGVARNPQHGSQTDENAQHLSPPGILVCAVCGESELDDEEQEDALDLHNEKCACWSGRTLM